MDTYTCPGCEVSSHVQVIASGIEPERVIVAPDYTTAILNRMKTLQRTYMDIDLLDDNKTICDSIGVTTTVEYTNLMKECGKPKATKRLLKRPGTMMIMGCGPSMCDSCDEIHVGDVNVGRVYEIDQDGVVWELCGMFAPMTMVALDIITN
jgi:hypothetical protein